MENNKKSRREFIKIMGTAFAGSLAGYAAFGRHEASFFDRKVTILHTNDTHSRLNPYPENDPRYPGMGGYSRRAALINMFRKEDPQLILLDAGDIFQGTAFYNIYKGEPELRLMSQMGYDASNIGNHEFDNGLKGLDNVLPFAGFPFISSNYDFSDTVLSGKIKDHLILTRNGIKVGIYALGIELKGLVGRDLYGATVYQDPLQTAIRMERKLRKREQCQLVICLSHLGYEYESGRISDTLLAKNTEYTDIIIGGHTHTLLNQPAVIENKKGNNVYIGQCGYGGVKIGKMNVSFNHDDKISFVEFNTYKVCKSQES